jgi:RNA polymerase sigma-70 factor (ECF subfamily)
MSERREERQEKFMLLYEPVHERLNRYCQAQTKSYEEARDLVSETVLTAYEKFESLRNPDTFLYFLFGIARNLVLQKRRKEKLMFVFRQSRDASSFEEEAKGPAEVDNLILQKALQQLSSEQRDAIVLFELSGFSLNEIAELQRTSLSNVKQRLLRGRAKLKLILGDRESLTEKVFQDKFNMI